VRYYRYVNYERGIEVLKTGRFRLSPISYFNDPFDGYGVAVGSMTDEACWHFAKRFRTELQRMFVNELGPIDVLIEASDEYYWEIVRKLLEKPERSYFTVEAVREWICAPRYQLMCLSSVENYKASNDILMWSHYADSCKGIRFEIDITEADILPGFSFNPMRYRHDRPLLNLSKVTTWDEDDVEFKRYVEDCLCTKSEVWNYESEVRFVADMKKCKYNIGSGHDCGGDYDYAYVTFPSDVIKKVCFGFAVNRKEVKEVCKKLRYDERFEGVEFLQMNLDLKDYNIKYKEVL
jgi:hypothetical protein